MAVRSVSSVFGSVILVIMLLAFSLPGSAQQGDLGQQMQLFNNLSPEQQQALLQRLGGGESGSTGTTAGSRIRSATR
jgi:hypothetical protein